MDVAAQFATLWTHFLIILKSCIESYVAAKFQLNMTFLVRDKNFFVKMTFFGNFSSVTLFLIMLTLINVKGGVI